MPTPNAQRSSCRFILHVFGSLWLGPVSLTFFKKKSLFWTSNLILFGFFQFCSCSDWTDFQIMVTCRLQEKKKGYVLVWSDMFRMTRVTYFPSSKPVNWSSWNLQFTGLQAKHTHTHLFGKESLTTMKCGTLPSTLLMSLSIPISSGRIFVSSPPLCSPPQHIESGLQLLALFTAGLLSSTQKATFEKSHEALLLLSTQPNTDYYKFPKIRSMLWITRY